MCMVSRGAMSVVCLGLVAGIGSYAAMHGFAAVESAAMAQPASKPPPAPASMPAQGASLVARGAYLWTIMSCTDCHTPKDEKGQPIAGMLMAGHPEHAPLPEWDPSMLKKGILVTMSPTLTAFAGPFGLSVAGNLTPDPETGIGKLTADDLIKSWHSGKHWKLGRPVLPPMPIQNYAAVTDDDVRAIFAFLSSLPPVKNKPPASAPAPAPGDAPAPAGGGK